MGLQTDLLSDINDAFDEDLSDAVISVIATHISLNDTDFDPSTGTNTPTKSTITIRGILSDVTKKDVDELGAISKTSKFLVLDSELIDLSISIGDTINDGIEEYSIYNEKIDPVKVVHTFFIKRSV